MKEKKKEWIRETTDKKEEKLGHGTEDAASGSSKLSKREHGSRVKRKFLCSGWRYFGQLVMMHCNPIVNARRK
jgi:hypothetical protein